MTNFSAIVILTCLIIAMIVDAVFYGSYGTVFVLKKLVGFRDGLAFWR